MTFVVYYRIHLNLNLEASARQWLNSVAHPGRENPTLEPQACRRDFCRLCVGRGGGGHLFIYLFLMLSAPKLGYRTGFQSPGDSLSFCERSAPERGSFAVVLMVLKPDNVPSSVRATGRCRGDHAGSLPVRKVTPALTISGVFLLGFS